MENEKRLIDANALREQMFSYYGCVNENTSKEYYRGETLMNYEVADLIEDCIDNAPTVDAVEVVHGHCDWCKPGEELCGTCRMFFDYYGDGGSDKCSSECNTKKCDYYVPIGFCPNCGAKMDGDGNG